MQDMNDDNFDLLLREHLSAELDGQLGRAPAAFARSSRRWPWRAVVIGAAGLAAAAILAIALMRPDAVQTTPTPPSAQAKAIPAEYELAWRTIDRGTVFLDEETPVRNYLRQQVEIVRWKDPETGQVIEVSVPHEQTMLVGLNTF
jgi:hypothetical protein